MIWRKWFQRRRMEEAGARARREHAEWLTAAVVGRRDYPRIPTRRSDRGGFGPMMDRPDGSGRAAAWWSGALSRVDGAGDD
ncbi:MAG: hypothetical protein AAGK04_13865 [Planctomycetota bacterium]